MPTDPTDSSGSKKFGSVRSYYLLAACAIMHSAILLVRAWEYMPKGLPEWITNDRFWITLALLWLLWPAAMALHPRRSWRRFVVPILLSLAFLAASANFYYWIIEEALYSLPTPTRDNPIVEKDEDLGGGFHRVMLSEYIEGGFESVYHGTYLFFGKRRLAPFSTADVAPSRRFAVYIDPQSHRPSLFRVAGETAVELSPEAVTDFGFFSWDEPNGKVILRYASNRSPQEFPLR